MTDARRVDHNEGANTFRSRKLHHLIQELDMRISNAECYAVFTRPLLITTAIDYYSDLAHTDKVARKEFTYVAGVDTVDRISQILYIFYNSDGSEDSRVTTTIARTDDQIDDCESPFTTSENTKL